MPKAIENHIENVYSKLQLLLKRYSDLENKNSRLSAENEKLQTNKVAMEEKLALMEQQLSILKASAGKLEGEEKTNFERSINQYIKTIEKTIALMTH